MAFEPPIRQYGTPGDGESGRLGEAEAGSHRKHDAKQVYSFACGFYFQAQPINEFTQRAGAMADLILN